VSIAIVPENESEDHQDSSQRIHVDEYQTPDFHVFAVFFDHRRWKRIREKNDQTGETGRWFECKTNGGLGAVSDAEEKWLEQVWLRSHEHINVSRFPRRNEFVEKLSLNGLTWNDLPRFDLARVSNTRWLIKHFIAECNLQLVFGQRGSFKSTLFLNAAKAVAGGEQFLGMKTHRRRVLYLDFENPANVIRGRCQDLGLDLAANPGLIIWDRFGVQPIPLPSDSVLEVIVNQSVSETGHGPWIIFDSWSSILRHGDGGEITGQIAPIYTQLRKLCDLGATITVLDHSRKYEGNVIYGGADKEAKVDSIHNLLTYQNLLRPENAIVRVESWLKRYAPKGIGVFSFEVQSEKDESGEWHVVALVPVRDPIREENRKKRQLLCDLIRKNPDAGQEALARLAAKKGLGRDEAIDILKAGTGKHWTAEKSQHGKLVYKTS
jgi:hypothetical protein